MAFKEVRLRKRKKETAKRIGEAIMDSVVTHPIEGSAVTRHGISQILLPRRTVLGRGGRSSWKRIHPASFCAGRDRRR